ncbi:MAG: prolyl oligopeptidase family serine peptidase [Pseudomonadales bacterium]|nr:prolyl oligopeptidase family serine peptidase [Pseudomonadales bacterium]
MFIRVFFLQLLVLISLYIVAFGTTPAYGWTFGPVQFESYDGTLIDAQLFTPNNYSKNENHPAIVLVPGWSMPKETTYPNAIEFANRGYVVISYSPRGYGFSGGLVDTAGPLDRDDFSSAVDWLIENARIDPERIGTGGVSYGGIIPLNSSSFDERIRAVAALDIPAEVEDAFYQGESPNAFWTQFLQLASNIGRPNPDIRKNLDGLFANENIPQILEWARERSPRSYIDFINDRQVPVFLSLNYRDRMFRPNSGIRYFENLIGPKLLQLHDGIHGAPVSESENYRSNTYFDWFDYWLRDIDNGVMDRPLVDVQLHRTSQRVGYQEWPALNIQNQTLYLAPNAERYTGDLLKEPEINNDLWALDSFFSSQESEQPTSGRPLTDAQADVFTDFETYDPDLAHAYQTDFLPSGAKLRGIPTVNMRIQAWDEQVQLVAYLYQINPDGQALYLTHGAKTFYDLFPGELVDLEIELTALMYDFTPGSRIGVAIDTQDPQYRRPPQPSFSLDVVHSLMMPNQINLPIEGELEFAAVEEEEEPETDPQTPDTSTPSEDDTDNVDRSSSGNSNSGGGGSGGSTGILLLMTTGLLALRRKQRLLS